MLVFAVKMLCLEYLFLVSVQDPAMVLNEARNNDDACMVRVTTNSVNPPTARSFSVNPDPAFALPQSRLLSRTNLFSAKMYPFRRPAESSHAVASDSRLVVPPLHDKDGSRARVC